MAQGTATVSPQTPDACKTPCPERASHDDGVLTDLPCGCQDVTWACGCICFEHTHVICDGTPLPTSTGVKS